MGLMQIPRRVDYGLRAIIYLSHQDPERCCSISEISAQQSIPKKFLEKIIQDLMRADLIRSRRGSCGGYALARSPEEISFHDVIEAIEGPIAVNNCVDEEGCCDQLPRCAMVSVWGEIQRKVTEVFIQTTLADLQKTPCGDFVRSSSLSSAA